MYQSSPRFEPATFLIHDLSWRLRPLDHRGSTTYYYVTHFYFADLQLVLYFIFILIISYYVNFVYGWNKFNSLSLKKVICHLFPSTSFKLRFEGIFFSYIILSPLKYLFRKTNFLRKILNIIVGKCFSILTLPWRLFMFNLGFLCWKVCSLEGKISVIKAKKVAVITNPTVCNWFFTNLSKPR